MEQAIHIENLTVYYGETEALSNVSFDVKEGEFLGIMGPNGGGKSTLLKSILGLIPVSQGKIEIFGKPVGKGHVSIGYVPQFASFDKKFPISVMEAVLTGRLSTSIKPFFHYSKQDRQIAMEKLEQVGMKDLAGRQIGELSGGEFQKMLIARALTLEPKILILDEPTASVDASSRAQIYELLEKINKEVTVLLVTHDLLAASEKIGKLACLNGSLVYHGEPELTQETVNKLYGCPVELIAHGVAHRVLQEHEGGCKC